MTLAPERPTTASRRVVARAAQLLAPRVTADAEAAPRSGDDPAPRHATTRLRRVLRSPLLLVAGDLGAAVLGTTAAGLAQSAWSVTPPISERLSFVDPSLAPLLVPLAWVLLVSVTHGYEPRTAADPASSRRHAVLLGPALMAGMLAAAAAEGVEVDARELLVLAAVTSACSVAVRSLVLLARGSAAAGRRVVVVGHRTEVEHLVDAFRRRPRGADLDVVGVVLHRASSKARFDVPVAEGVEALTDAVDRLGADTVVMMPCRHVPRDRMRRLAWDLDDRGAELLVGGGLMDVAPGRARVHGGPGVPLLHVRHADLDSWRRRALKAGWERGFAALVLLALAPLMLLLALAIRLEGPGPAIFRQTRVGLDGRTFRLLKLRTMTPGTAHGPTAHLGRNDGAGPLFKMREDPRVTRLGRRLRRYSLDELPQLMNVLRGDMSLIGPRPPLPEEVATYDDLVRRRLRVKPGLTGAWQVSGRSDLSWQESVRIDLDYVDNWSVWTDVAILARTPFAVLGHRGAY